MRYLITGGTGSFGQAMTKKLLVNGHDVAVLSRGEHAQHDMAQSLIGFEERVRFFIGDVRDRSRLRRAFDGCDVVLHAAALKRIEVGFYNPSEMVATNVLGAVNVIEACKDAGVGRCVFLSTDKAWQPVSAYGYSKALAETLFLNAYQKGTGTEFVATRYGNVWKSAGSVVPKWLSFMDQGIRRLPVTDPDATRFFMTMGEATELVYNASRHPPTGKVVIPHLPAYRLGDVVDALTGEMEIIGMEPWEKKHEGMSAELTSDIVRRMTIEEIRSHL